MFGAMIMNSWVSGKLSVFLEIEYAVWIAQDRRSIGGCALAGHLSEFVERTYDVCWKRACERINRICKRIQLITGLNSENTPVPVNFELPPLAPSRLLSPPLALTLSTLSICEWKFIKSAANYLEYGIPCVHSVVLSSALSSLTHAVTRTGMSELIRQASN